MNRTVIGTRASDSAHVLVERRFSVGKWSATVLTVMGALYAVLKCILESGVL